MKMPAIYILTNRKDGTLYIGVTSNLPQRVYIHKFVKVGKSFSHRYNLNKLVYYEVFENMEEAITREKRLKTWRRAWKVDLIEKMNPEWQDLYESIL